MRNRHLLAVVATGLLTVALVACSSGKDADATDTDAGGGGASPLATCTGNAITTTGLPADFPVPDGVTFTATAVAGPTTIVDGYGEGDVAGFLSSWKDAVDSAGYTVLSTDDEAPSDAEINYQSADGKTSGQIALRDQCGGNGKIAVHITNRPA
jgi:hypothetical protein